MDSSLEGSEYGSGYVAGLVVASKKCHPHRLPSFPRAPALGKWERVPRLDFRTYRSLLKVVVLS